MLIIPSSFNVPNSLLYKQWFSWETVTDNLNLECLIISFGALELNVKNEKYHWL